jgi:hypothetical protein
MTVTVNSSNITFSDSSVQLAAAKILSVNQTVLSGTVSIASSSFVNVTGLSVTVTPKSSSSTFLIYLHATISTSDNASGTMVSKFFRVTRSGTVVGVGDARGSATSALANSTTTYNANYPQTQGAHFKDSPATASSITYQVQAATEGARASVVGGSYNSGNYYNSSVITTLTVLEIG